MEAQEGGDYIERGEAGAGIGGGGVHTVDTEVTLSLERSSFDLIIWEGQSAFVDEESL